MGDRVNIAFRQLQLNNDNPPYIFLYGHWGGASFPAQLQEALRFSHDRWNDDSYLARICISRICRDAVDDTTGFGVSTCRTDNEHDILVVDSEAQTVQVVSKAGWFNGTWTGSEVLAQWTFEEYCALKLPDNCTPEMLVQLRSDQPPPAPDK